MDDQELDRQTQALMEAVDGLSLDQRRRVLLAVANLLDPPAPPPSLLGIRRAEARVYDWGRIANHIRKQADE